MRLWRFTCLDLAVALAHKGADECDGTTND